MTFKAGPGDEHLRPEPQSTRAYETNAYLPYHTGLSDVVGLMSIRKAKAGRLSSLAPDFPGRNSIPARGEQHVY